MTDVSRHHPYRYAWFRHWPVALLLLFLLLIFWTWRDFGVTWDEHVQAHYGELCLRYFSSGFRDLSANHYLNLRFYGPLVEITVAGLGHLFGFSIRHLVLAFCALFAFVGVYQLTRHYRAPALCFFAVLSLFGMPRFYGHMFNNSKDIPFAAFFVMAMLGLVLLFRPRVFRWRASILAGLAVGICLSVRTGGFLLYAYGILLLAVYLLLLAIQEKASGHSLSESIKTGLQRKEFRRLFYGFFLVLGISWLVMVSLWPWAHQDIIRNPIQAFFESVRFFKPVMVLFEGEVIPSNQLPRYYLPKYLLLTTPIPMLGLALLGTVRLLLDFRNPSREIFLRVLDFSILLAAFFPIAYATVMSPNVYDGMRHFLFVLPFVAILSGVGANFLFQAWLSRAKGKHLAFVLVTLFLGMSLFSLYRLHPYQMTYFNVFAGTSRYAATQYETDYWLSSYKEAMEWVNSDSKRLKKKKVTVLVAGNQHGLYCASSYKAKHIRLLNMYELHVPGRLPAHVDYYIATTRYGLNRNFPDSKVRHAIQRDGAVFSVIKSNH